MSVQTAYVYIILYIIYVYFYVYLLDEMDDGEWDDDDEYSDDGQVDGQEDGLDVSMRQELASPDKLYYGWGRGIRVWSPCLYSELLSLHCGVTRGRRVISMQANWIKLILVEN